MSTKNAGPLVVVMGVSGSGKSTVGPLVASALGVSFLDGDDYHDPANVERMRRGEALTDTERLPWLHRLHDVLAAHATEGVVLACSALKRDYRSLLRGNLAQVASVALRVGRDELEERLEQRTGHFAGPELLASQLSALDVDDVIAVDGEREAGAVCDEILAAIAGPPS